MVIKSLERAIIDGDAFAVRVAFWDTLLCSSNINDDPCRALLLISTSEKMSEEIIESVLDLMDISSGGVLMVNPFYLIRYTLVHLGVVMAKEDISDEIIELAANAPEMHNNWDKIFELSKEDFIEFLVAAQASEGLCAWIAAPLAGKILGLGLLSPSMFLQALVYSELEVDSCAFAGLLLERIFGDSGSDEEELDGSEEDELEDEKSEDVGAKES